MSDGTAVGPDSEPVDLDSMEPLTRCRGIPADGEAPLRLDRSRLRDSVGLTPTSPLDEHFSVGARVSFPTSGNLAEAAVDGVRCAGSRSGNVRRPRSHPGEAAGRRLGTERPCQRWTIDRPIHPNGRWCPTCPIMDTFTATNSDVTCAIRKEESP